jgi:uncharacterized membrane protein
MDFSIYLIVATAVFIFFAILAAYIFWRNAKKNKAQRSLSLCSSIVFGWLSVFSFVGLILAMILPPFNAYEQLFLAYLPLPGLLSGFFAIIMGIIAYVREKTRASLWGIVLGGITIIVIAVLFLTPAGGTPFLCSNNYGCSALKNDSQCTADLFFLPHTLQDLSYSLHVGVCVQPPSEPGLQ